MLYQLSYTPNGTPRKYYFRENPFAAGEVARERATRKAHAAIS